MSSRLRYWILSGALGVLSVITVASTSPAPGPRPGDWFNRPSVNFQGGFLEPKVNVKWSVRCLPSIIKERFADWNTLLKKRAGLSGRESFPRGVHIEDLSQFWKQKDRYHQISMFWEEDFPPTYRLKHFASKDPNLRERVQDLPISPQSGDEPVDVETALTAIEGIYRQAQRDGASDGARTMLVAVTTRDDGGKKVTHRAEYLNGLALNYWDDGVTCVLQEDRKTVRCDCNKVGAQQ